MKKKHAFLSYVREDQAQVDRLRADLLAAGEQVWWDHDIEAGADWDLAIRQALLDAHSFLLCLSAASDGRERSGTFPELREAIGRQRELRPGAIFIIPVRLESSSVPRFPIDATRMLDSLQHIDLFPAQTRDRSLARLITSIRASPIHPLRQPSFDAVSAADAQSIGRADRLSRPTLLRLLFDRAAPSLHALLTRLRVLAEPPDWQELSRYLRRIRANVENELARKTYIPPVSREVERDPSFDGTSDPFVRPIHQVIREVMGRSRGGDAANAQIAAVNRKSRIVRDLLRTLMRAKEPIVLLGDPGTGKTMTLQSLVIELARREERRVFPLIPVYVRLGEFHSDGPVNADTVFDYLAKCCPPELRPYLRDLDNARGRLIVVFDGMDEMSRERYTEHTEALSLFAAERVDVTKTLFSCRITDFSPSFTHRRLVILPFNQTQVAEFLRRHIARFPAEIDGQAYTLKRLAAAIVRGDLPFDAKNPFVLWLLCFQLSTMHRFPASRVEMLDFYVREAYRRKAHTLLGGEQKLPAIDVAIAAWEELAFRIAAENRGTAISVAELASNSRHGDLHQVLHAGRMCGVLDESHDRQGHLVRFAHHRFQEYFAARFISRQGTAIDWLPTLDTPRWQETMINVVLLGGGTEGVQALTRSIEEKTEQLHAHWQAIDQRAARMAELKSTASGEPQDQRLLSDAAVEVLETVLADRVDFAFRLLRQAAGATRPACVELSAPLKAALKLLSDRGNPVTQVKMLTVCRNAPAVDYLEALRTPLNSSVGWVRSQAIAMLGAIGARGAALGSDLPTEIGYELGRASLLQQVPTYFKAARDSQRPRDIVCLAFGAVLHVLLFALLAVGALLPLAVPGSGWMSSTFGRGALSAADFATLYLASIGVGVAAALFFKPAGTWWLVLGAPALFLMSLWAGVTLWQGYVIHAVLVPFAVFMFASPILILLGFAIAFPSVFLTVGAYLLATHHVRMSRHPTRAFAADVWRHCGFADGWEWVKTGGTAALVLVVFSLGMELLVGGVFRKVLDWLAELFPNYSRGEITMLVLAVIAFFFVAGLVIQRIDLKYPGRSVLAACAGTAGYAALLALGWAFAKGLFDPALTGLSYYVGRGGAIALALGLVAAAAYYTWRAIQYYLLMRLMSRRPYPPQSFAADEWAKRLAQMETEGQRYLLMRTTHQSVGLTPRDYLELLKKHRPAIKEGPAEDLYWQQRHDLEQVLRQELA